MVKGLRAGKAVSMHEKQETTESRKAHNEALLRDANESIRAVQEDLDAPRDYCVVAKSGISGEIAEETNPRGND